ncbi:MAG: integrase core domain-containing protein [Akkermansia sp.]|nr:integrase core domain-containing protein [Akkermansia sp.]
MTDLPLHTSTIPPFCKKKVDLERNSQFLTQCQFFLHREPKNLDEAIEMTSEWMEYYNRERPHSSLKNCSPLMYRENHATPLPANFWRDFSAPARLASLRSAPSLRSGRHAYASKSRQKWLDIRGYRMIYETHTPHAHKRGLKLAS